jgi:(1->4)-alpha-D-glucan 1-alpha-D-glucosylmutase
VLSEIPEEWARQTSLWSRILRARRGEIEAAGPPDPNDEYMFYQLLVGTWPVELTCSDDLDAGALKEYGERLKGAVRKSLREAKVHSTWASPDTAYENAVLTFVDSALHPDSRAFHEAFLPFQERIARLGVRDSLVQTALKLTCPGVPDIYQGAELWDLSMVDPDNRRPVDYETRTRLLDTPASVRELLEQWQDGAVKQSLIRTILKFRASDPDLFARGGYEPLPATGPQGDCICAFARRFETRSMLVATARFPARRENDPGWNGTAVPVPPSWAVNKFSNLVTGLEVSASEGVLDADSLFREFPVAVLTPPRAPFAVAERDRSPL